MTMDIEMEMDMIEEYKSNKFSLDELELIYNVHKSTIYRILKKHNISASRRDVLPQDYKVEDIDDERSCCMCGEFKNRDECFKFIKLTGKYHIRCYSCESELKRAKRRDDFSFNVRDRVNTLNSKAKNRGYPGGFTKEHYLGLLEKQNYNCFYTDLPLRLEPSNNEAEKRYSFSVDKIIPELGYVNGNVVPCLNFVNRMKNDCSLEELKITNKKWFNRVVKHLKEHKVKY